MQYYNSYTTPQQGPHLEVSFHTADSILDSLGPWQPPLYINIKYTVQKNGNQQHVSQSKRF